MQYRSRLREMLEAEYDLYNLAVQRLEAQLRAIDISN